MEASERKNGYLGQVRMSESRPQPQGTNRKVCDAAGAEEAKAASIGKRKRRLCEELETVSGGNGERVPPVPIPNTEVKPFSADGTWLDTARESRSPPDSIPGWGKIHPDCLKSSMAEHSAVNRRVVGSSPS